MAYRLAEKLCLDTDLVQPVSCQSAGVTYAPRHTTLAPDRLQALGMDAPEARQVIDQLYGGRPFQDRTIVSLWYNTYKLPDPGYVNLPAHP
jgi:hypothetical protein